MTRPYTFDSKLINEFTPVKDILYQNLPVKLEYPLHIAGWYISCAENLVRILGRSKTGNYIGIEVDPKTQILYARLYGESGIPPKELMEISSDFGPIRCECPECKALNFLKRAVCKSEVYKRRVMELARLFDTFTFGKVYPFNNSFCNPQKIMEKKRNDR